MFLPVLFCSREAHARHSFSVSSIENGDGLSSNTVKAIHQDQFGFMWFGTKNGLNRYDGRNIRRYNCYDPESKRGNNNIGAIYEHGDSLWLGTDRGVFVYDMRLGRFIHFDGKSREGIGIDDWVADILGDLDGNLWVMVPNQGVFRIADNKVDFFSVTDHGGDKSKLPQCMTLVGRDLYIGTLNQGVFRYDANAGKFREAGNQAACMKLRNRQIVTMESLGEHTLLLGDTNGYFYVYDTLTSDVRDIPFSRGGQVYLRTALKIDDELWIGTQNGLFILNITDGSETRIDPSTMGGSGLSDNIIYTLCADRDGNVWAGTMFGGVNFLQRRGLVFEKYTVGSSERSLSGKLVRGLAATDDGHIYVGLEDGGLDVIDSRTAAVRRGAEVGATSGVLTVKSHGNKVFVGQVRNGLSVIEPGMASTLLCKNLDGEENSVYAVLNDSKGNLWVGLEWGLYRRDAGSNAFKQAHDIGYDWIVDIYEASDSTLWIASMGNGVWHYMPATDTYRHYAFDEGYSNGLRSNSVSAVTEDSRGHIWLSTDRGGLSRYNPSTDDFTTYSIEEGLPDNVVYNVLEDENGFLWFGTNNGLVKFNPETGAIKLFTSRHGDMVVSYNYNSAVRGADGRFYFGGIGGVIAFDPAKDEVVDSLPPLYLTNMRMGNDEVMIGAEGSPLKENLLYANSIEVPHSSGTISFSLALPNYANHSAVRYSYRLLPNDKEWIQISDPGNLSFVGLGAGDYTLEIMAESGGLNSIRPYNLSVLPSWYETWWATLIYILLFGALVYTAWRYWKYRQEREMIKRANMMSMRKEKELYKNKIQFFTEIAHEIRTPLSLIGSPLEAIDEIGVKDERVERYLKTIRLNTTRLLDLTNHLLDFQKIDGLQHELTFGNVDVTAMVHSIVNRFELTMKLRDKQLDVSLPDRAVMATIDKEAVTKVMSNLFNNALKYSHNRISISLTADETMFRLEVASDGDTIVGENRLKIFEPFYQIETNGHAGGVGIGLPLSSTLAKLHNGSLVLADTSSLSNTFVLEIPLRQEGVEPEAEPSATMAEYVMEEESAFTPTADGYSLLFVKDNDEMRDFLSEQLSKSFSVETAVDGNAALELLKERKFDMIVTDIMMPGMDGYELCRKVKENVDLSHIPVVFLTAKNDLESKVKALKCGGEAYIEKPFSIKYFRQQIMSLLDNRQHERKAFLKKPFFTVDNMKLNKADEEFMDKVIDIITENIGDENFSVESMADTFCMSRSSLLRRIKTLFNLSPVELIRLIKLKKAAELIQEGKYRIGDVCYMVGINSSSYFSKLFFRQFGVTPKAFEKQCLKKSQAPAAAKEKLEGDGHPEEA